MQRRRTNLTDDEVRTIYTSKLRAPEVMRRFNISLITVRAIRNRKAYSHLTSDYPSRRRSRSRSQRFIPVETKEAIRAASGSVAEIAERFGVSSSSVSLIRGPSRPRGRGQKRYRAPTPGIDFDHLCQAHQNLERPEHAVGRIRIKPDYLGGREIIAHLIPLKTNRSAPT